MQILLIEDNPQLSRLLEKSFREQGYPMDPIGTGKEGEEAAVIKSYDIIILDRLLPDRDGLETCKNLRRRGITTPIILLTALGETEEKVHGLDAGADDYLAKPFEFEELLARMRALLRRGSPGESTRLTYDTLEMDLAKRRVTRDGRPITLTIREFALLEFLVRNKDRTVSRTEIGEHVWETNYERTSNVIDVYITMLRKKVDKGFSKPLIHTVPGAGYMLAADKHSI